MSHLCNIKHHLVLDNGQMIAQCCHLVSSQETYHKAHLLIKLHLASPPHAVRFYSGNGRQNIEPVRSAHRGSSENPSDKRRSEESLNVFPMTREHVVYCVEHVVRAVVTYDNMGGARARGGGDKVQVVPAGRDSVTCMRGGRIRLVLGLLRREHLGK